MAATLSVNPFAAQQYVPQGITSSGADIDLLAQYFGPPTQKVKPDQYQGRPVTHWTLPEYYKKRHLHLKELVEGLVYERNPWTTGRALPWYYNEDITVTMDIWTLKHGMIEQLPHEGIPKLLEASKSSWQDAQMRFGIAVEFEGDFYRTPEGHTQFLRSMTGIQKFVQERANNGVLQSLLSSNTYKKMWTQLYGESRISWVTLFDEIVEQTGILHHYRNGWKSLKILTQQHKDAMQLSTTPVKPDLLIIPPGMGIFLRYGANKTMKMYAMSQEGKLLIRDGPNAWVFDGTGEIDVVEAQDYGVHESDMPAQHLKRRKIIGQHFPMYVWFRNKENISAYNNEWRNIFILDLKGEQWKKITFQDAFLRCQIFDEETGYYKNELLDYIKSNKGDWSPYSAQREQELSLRKDGISPDESSKLPFFLASDVDGRGNYEALTHFGQAEQRTIHLNDFKHMAQTLIAQFAMGREESFTETVFNMYKLIHKIENTGNADELFNHFLAVIGQINAATSVELAKVNGSFDAGKFPLMTGFNNGPGLRSLANAGNGEAANAVEFLTRLQGFLTRTLPRCEMNDKKNIEPWFDQEDTISLLYSLVGMDRVPLFVNLSYAGGSGVTAAVRGDVLNIGQVPEFAQLITALGTASVDADHLRRFLNTFTESLPKSADQFQFVRVIIQLKKEYDERDPKKNPDDAKNYLRSLIDDLYYGMLASQAGPKDDEKIDNKTQKELEDHKKKSKAFILRASKVQIDENRYKPPSKTPLLTGNENWVLTPLTSTPALVRALRDELGTADFPKLWALVRPADPTTGYKKPIDPTIPISLERLTDFANIKSMHDVMTNPGIKSANTLKVTQKMQTQIRGLDFGAQNNSFSRTEEQFRSSASRYDENTEMSNILTGFAKKFSKVGESMSESRKQSLTPFTLTTEQQSRAANMDSPDIERPGFTRNWHDSNIKISHPLTRIFVQCVLTTRCDHINDWMHLIENHIHVPINILIWRPVMKFHFYTVILMKSGLDTGATMHGHSNFMLSGDGITKKWLGNYSLYMGPMVWNSNNVHLIEDVGCGGYEDGADGDWMKDPKETLAHASEYAPQAERGSLIPTMVPITETYPSTNMCIAGKLSLPCFDSRLDKPNVNTWSTSPYYASILGLDHVVSNVRQEILNYYRMSHHFTGNTRPGSYWTYNTITSEYSVFHEGNGHMKGGENPESASIWKRGGGLFASPSEIKTPHLI